MKIISYGLLFIIGIGIMIYVIGYFLPETRKLTKETVYYANAEKVYNVITDNQNWQYRTSLDNLEILAQDGENEVWQETTNDITILFKTREKRPFEYYAFDMSSQFFTGEWHATLTPIDEKQTRFEATESLTFPNPFIRVLSYLFMDLEKFMQTYEDELRKKLEKE